MQPRQGDQRLVSTATYMAGTLLPRQAERPLHVWALLPAHQRTGATAG
jgi:hypothetical protein